ncbi:hypothetical protein BTN82_15035 [Pseudomonas chlororaphis]|uniref:Uncharacterized protein n=1 Tax=Pseudomonas chlororaphis TaxID=587753 RepID=A0A1Q8EPR4_9PSED|nr:hypothetical protein BTN82_15035 [Pseudomonas chlororaphis]
MRTSLNTIHCIQRQQLSTVLLGLDAEKYCVSSFDYICGFSIATFSADFFGDEPCDVGELFFILDIAYG